MDPNIRAERQKNFERHPPSFNGANLNIISDEFSTEFIITGASFPKDLLKQIVAAFNVSV